MREIRRRHEFPATDSDAPQPPPDPSDSQSEIDPVQWPTDDLYSDDLPQHDMSPSAGNLHSPETRPRRVLPDAAAYRLYSNWLVLVPTLVHNYLDYMQRTQGRLGRPPGVQAMMCQTGFCILKEFDIQCLHFDCKLSDAL